MRFRSLVSVLTLLAFAPVAAGCSSRHTSYIQSDPVTDATTAQLASGKQVEVSGYTSRIDGYHRWNGQVSATGADSLRFKHGSVQEPPFRLARADVVSLEVETTDGAKTAGAIGVVVGVLAIALVVAFARGINEGFEPLRNAGSR